MSIKHDAAPRSTQRVRLLKPHRHAGRDYPAGAALDLAADKAAWLIGVGVAQEGAPQPAPAKTPKE